MDKVKLNLTKIEKLTHFLLICTEGSSIEEYFSQYCPNIITMEEFDYIYRSFNDINLLRTGLLTCEENFKNMRLNMRYLSNENVEQSVNSLKNIMYQTLENNIKILCDINETCDKVFIILDKIPAFCGI